ncbi:MAG TPA: hypothetical protein VF523_05450, partial [Burkholderiales bacterium]
AIQKAKAHARRLARHGQLIWSLGYILVATILAGAALSVRPVFPWWHVVLGFALTVFLGAFTGVLVKCAGDFVRTPKAPFPEIRKEWTALVDMNTGGKYIGLVELPIFFAACSLPEAWPLAASWLVMKTAFYWQSANFSAYPERPPNKRMARWLAAKRHMGSHHVATALVGTGANACSALAGVYLAWILERWPGTINFGY